MPQEASPPTGATPQPAKPPAPPKPKLRPKSVVSAIKLVAAESPDGRVSVSALGSYLRRTDPSFSPQTYGHSGLVSMLKTYDLLDLRLETGGHWSVALAAAPDSTSAVAATE
jgi:hypothetical protein